MEMLPHEDLVFNLRAFSFAERIGFIPDSSPYHYLCRDGMSAAGSFSPDHLLACQLTEDAFRQFFKKIHDWNSCDMEFYLRSKRITDCPVRGTSVLSSHYSEIRPQRQIPGIAPSRSTVKSPGSTTQ